MLGVERISAVGRRACNRVGIAGALRRIRSAMRKIYPLTSPDKHADRVLEAVKHDIRKYVRRERRREVPDGMDYWDFDCRFGTEAPSAASVHLAEVIASVDAAAKAGEAQCYVEIIARAAVRKPRTASDGDTPPSGDDANGGDDELSAPA
jgi:hypothetical protein